METQDEGEVDMFGKEASVYWPCQTLFLWTGWTCQFMSFVFGHIGDEDVGSPKGVRGMFVLTDQSDVCLSQRSFINHQRYDAGLCPHKCRHKTYKYIFIVSEDLSQHQIL